MITDEFNAEIQAFNMIFDSLAKQPNGKFKSNHRGIGGTRAEEDFLVCGNFDDTCCIC